MRLCQKVPTSYDEIVDWELDLDKILKYLTGGELNFKNNSYEGFMAFKKAVDGFKEGKGEFVPHLYWNIRSQLQVYRYHQKKQALDDEWPERNTGDLSPNQLKSIEDLNRATSKEKSEEDTYLDSIYLESILKKAKKRDIKFVKEVATGKSCALVGKKRGLSAQNSRHEYLRALKRIRKANGIYV